MKIKPTTKAGGVVLELSASEAQFPMAPVEPTAMLLPAFQLKKILVPVDFSDCSRKALQYALPFARQFGAKLSLLYVMQPYIPVPEMTAVNLDLTRKQLMLNAQSEMKTMQQAVPTDVTSEWFVRDGTPYVEIVNTAKESGADLIILSTHGHTGLAHVFLGSTAERVVRHAPCPVLVVREREHEFVAGKTAGAGG